MPSTESHNSTKFGNDAQIINNRNVLQTFLKCSNLFSKYHRVFSIDWMKFLRGPNNRPCPHFGDAGSATCSLQALHLTNLFLDFWLLVLLLHSIYSNINKVIDRYVHMFLRNIHKAPGYKKSLYYIKTTKLQNSSSSKKLPTGKNKPFFIFFGWIVDSL